MLAIPDCRQATGFDCGPTVFRAVVEFFGLTPDKSPDSHELTGLSPDYLETAFRRAGCRVASGDMTVDDLRWHTALGRPVVCLVTEAGTGHYVVCRHVGHRSRVHFHDPLSGRRSLSKRAFLAGWRDVHRLGGVYDRFGLAVWV